MQPSSPCVPRILLFVATCCLSFLPTVAFAAASRSGPTLVVPQVKTGTSVATRVAITNHGYTPVDIAISVVDATTGQPTRYPCTFANGQVVLSSLETALLDLATDCSLPAQPFDGAMFVEAATGELVSLSGRATLAVRNATGSIESESDLPVLPLAALPTRDASLRIDDLESDPNGGGPQVDCVTVAGPSASTAVITGELLLEGRPGAPIGRPLVIKVQPGGAIKLDNVFGQAGATMAHRGVRARWELTSGPQVAIGAQCMTIVQRPGSAVPAVSVHAATPPHGTGTTRQRQVRVDRLQNSPMLSVTGSESALHVVFLRHQDHLACSVRSLSGTPSTELQLTAVAPDRSRVLGGTGPDIERVDLGFKEATNGGVAAAWGLLVEQARPSPSVTIPYALSCESGNGLSQPLLKIRFAAPPQRP